MKKYLLSITILAALLANKANAQDDKDKKNTTVGTEVVNVTSEYQATLNDAFKINDNPLIEDEDINQKKDVKYTIRSEEHTSELQSRENLVCRLLLEKK